jgi:hypothetical protein
MASTKLTRTPGSAGNRKTWTFSAWIKKGKVSAEQGLLWSNPDTNNHTAIRFTSANELRCLHVASGSTGNGFDKKTNRLFRDVNAWYHIVVAVDTTLSTATDRVKFYVNGVQETSFATDTFGASQNLDTYINSTELQEIGNENSAQYFDGSMAHVHLTDGTAYAASTFGETDSTSGIWKPKTGPSVTYGTNGFFLKFQDSSSLGDDSSGNTNDWTLNGSGTQTLDTPSNVFTTGNSLIKGTNGNSNGNNTTTSGQNSWESMWSTLGASSGKWYAEFKPTNLGTNVGMAAGATQTEEIKTFDEIVGKVGGVHYQSHGSIYNNNVETESGGSPYSTYTTNDIIGVAIDLDNNYIYFAKNGTWQNSGDPTSGASGTGGISLTANKVYHFGFGAYNSTVTANFGNGYFATTAVSSAENDDAGYGKFEYDVPTGYYALCTKNINTYG